MKKYEIISLNSKKIRNEIKGKLKNILPRIESPIDFLKIKFRGVKHGQDRKSKTTFQNS